MKTRYRRTVLVIMTAILVIALTGCGADDIMAPAATVADMTPPAPPVGLNAAQGRSAVKISWRANTTDLDLAGYRVYRLAFGQTWPLTPENLTEPRFLDRNPLTGPAVYAITAVDRAGNESAWATVAYDMPVSAPSPTRGP